MAVSTRRAVLAGVFAGTVASARAAAAQPRLVSLDWGLTATALELGARPVGIAEQRLYRDWVGTPPIPAGIAEVGLRGSPSGETLAGLKPDLIGVNALNAPTLDRLERIAPTFMNFTFSEERAPLRRAREVARAFGARLGRSSEAAALIENADAAIAAARTRVKPLAIGQPLVPAVAVDGRHVTVYGAGSLYHDVLTALALPTADVGPTSMWGYRTLAVADIAALMPADLLVIAPLGPAARAAMEGPGLWRRLLAAGGGRQFVLPAAWAYGDIASAARFATLVADALTGGSPA